MERQKTDPFGLFLILVLVAGFLTFTSCQPLSNRESKEIQGIWVPSGWSCPIDKFCQQIEFQPNGKLVLTQTDITGKYAVIAPGKIKIVIEDISLAAEYRIRGKTLTLSFKEGDQEYNLLHQPTNEGLREVDLPSPVVEDLNLVIEDLDVTEETFLAETQPPPKPRVIDLTLISTLDAREVLDKNTHYRLNSNGEMVATAVFYFSPLFSTDSEYLFTSAGDNGEMVWDLTAGEVISDIRGRSFDLRISADDRFLLTETTYCTILVSDPLSLEIVDEIYLDEGCTSLYDLHPSENIVAVSVGNNEIALVNLESGEVLGNTPELNDYPTNARFSGDGQWLIAVDISGNVSVFDLQNYSQTAIRFKLQKPAYHIEPSPTEPLIAYTSRWTNDAWNGILISNYLSQENWAIDYPTPIDTLSFLPNGQVISGITEKGEVILWDTHSGELLAEIPTQGKPVSGIVSSKNESLFAITYFDGFIEIWEVIER